MGPPGETLTLAVDPFSSGVVYAGSAAGVYRTGDGGLHWSPANTGFDGHAPVVGLAAAPDSSGHLYAVPSGEPDGSGSRGPFTSDDGGRHWHGPATAIDPLLAFTLAVDPSDGDVAFLAGAGSPSLYRTANGGQSWDPIPNAFGEVGLSMAVDPSDSSIVYAGTGGGVYRSPDGGSTWDRVSDTLPGNNVGVNAVAVDATGRVYAGMSVHGVYESVDGGQHWHGFNDGLGNLRVLSLDLDPSDPQILFAGTRGGLYRSADRGGHWSRVVPPAVGGSVNAVAVAPWDTATVFAATSRGIVISRDGGIEWSFARAGLAGACLASLAVDPADPAAVAAAGANYPVVHRSQDAGRTWTDATRGLPTGVRGLGALALDPSDPSTLYLATQQTRPAAVSGLFKSTDGGSRWRESDQGIEDTAVGPIAVVPSSPSTLYAGSDTVYRSDDGGQTWAPTALAPSTGNRVSSIAVSPSDPNTLYAGEKDDGFDTAGAHLYGSRDGGATWKKLVGLGVGYTVTAVGLDPADPGTIFVAARARFFNPPVVLRSRDGGRTWRSVDQLFGLGVNGFTFDLVVPTTVYAATGTHGVMVSADLGVTWSDMSVGLQSLDVRALYRDPSGSPMYAATCGGLYRLGPG